MQDIYEKGSAIMTTIERDDVYAYVNELQAPEELIVYVDASYKYNMERGKHEAAAFSAGWIIKHPTKPKVLGYGTRAIWDTPANDPGIAELRAILGFLDILKEEFPSTFSRLKTLHIYGDNDKVVENIENNFIPVGDTKAFGTSRDFVIDRYGKDYLRFKEYSDVINIRGHWVKGHSTDVYNAFADRLASYTFQSMILEGRFYGEIRRDAICQQFTMKNLVSMPKSGVLDLLVFEERKKATAVNASTLSKAITDYDKVYVGFHCEKENRTQNHLVGFTYLNPSNRTHEKAIEEYDGTPSKPLLTLRSVVFALKAYKNEQNFDSTRPVVIHTAGKDFIRILNNELNGREQSAIHEDKELLNELLRFKEMIEGLEVGFYNQAFVDVCDHARDISCLNVHARMGMLSNKGPSYDKRLKVKLQKSFGPNAHASA